MRTLKLLAGWTLLIAVAVYGIFFSIYNTGATELHLVFTQLSEQPLALWIWLFFALGGIIGMLISAAAIMRLKTQLLLLRRKLDGKDKELDKLRITALRPESLKGKKMRTTSTSVPALKN